MKDPWSSWSSCVLKKKSMEALHLWAAIIVINIKKKNVLLLELSIQSTFLESQIKN